MDYFWLYLGVLITWILNLSATGAQRAVSAVKSGKEDLGGVSIMWGIFVMPVFFTGIAWLINWIWLTMGFWVIGSFHALFGLWMLGYIVYAVIFIKLNERNLD